MQGTNPTNALSSFPQGNENAVPLQMALDSLFARYSFQVTPQDSYLYVNQNNVEPNKNALIGYRINRSDGSLTLLDHPSTLTGGTGFADPSFKLGPFDNDQNIAVSNDKSTLFATNPGSNTLVAFRIQPDGSLKTVPGWPIATQGETPVSIGIGHDGRLTVLNSAENPASTTRPNFATIDPTSATAEAKVAATFSLGQKPTQALTLDGGNIVVTSLFPDIGNIISYKYDESGNLTQVSSLTPPGGVADPVSGLDNGSGAVLGLWSPPGSSYIYAGQPKINQLAVYKYDSSGALSLVTTVPNQGQAICWIRTTDDGRFLISANTGDDSLSVYDLADPAKPKEVQHVILDSKAGAFGATQFSFDANEQHLYVLEQNEDPSTQAARFGNIVHVLSFDKNTGHLTVQNSLVTSIPEIQAKDRSFGILAVKPNFFATQDNAISPAQVVSFKSYSYQGSNQTVQSSLLAASADGTSATSTVVNLSSLDSGVLDFSGVSEQNFDNSALLFTTTAPQNGNNVLVDLKALEDSGGTAPATVAYGLGKNYSFNTTAALNTQRSLYTRYIGVAEDNRVNVFVSDTYTSSQNHAVDIQNTQLVANGHYYNTPSVLQVIDEGGNYIWAGIQTTNVEVARAPDHALTLNSSALLGQTAPSIQQSDSTVFIGGGSTGNFVFNDAGTEFSDTVSNALSSGDTPGGNTSSVGIRHIDIVLNAAEAFGVQSYNVTQNSGASANLFQENGSLSFSGKNTTIVLNKERSSFYPPYVTASLNLTGNDTVWAGSGSSNITLAGGDNTVIATGRRGSTVINGQTDATIPAGTLKLINSLKPSSNSTLIYNQGIENATIDTAQYHTFTAHLNKGNTTITLATEGSIFDNFFTNNDITLGTGNLVLNNFINQPYERNLHLHLTTNQNILDHTFANGNTTFTLNTGNTVVFTGVDLKNTSLFS